jgi:predicted HTH transcriptional regulator
MRDLSTLPIDAIHVGDIEALVSVEESPSLEFKRSLPTTDGRPDPWMSNQSSAYARDQIAKEIVAFANAYGGIVIVGIDETDDKPASAKEEIPNPSRRGAELA